MKHRLGIIGFGSMASRYHCGTADRMEDLEVGGVYDIRAERLEEAEKRGYKTFKTLDAFFDSRAFDIVVVATPNNFHCPLAKKALEAGYNVVSEKPAAVCTEELEETIEVAKKSGKIYTVHQNRRWDGDYLLIKEVLKRGFVGKPYMIMSRINMDRGAMYGWRAYEVDGGGLLRDWGVHMLDQLMCLITEPVVAVSAVVSDIKTPESDDYANLLLRFESGLGAQIEVSNYTLQKLPRWTVYGDLGTAVMHDMKDTCCHIKRAVNQKWYDEMQPVYLENGTIEMRPMHMKNEEYEEFEFSDVPDNLGWETFYRNLMDTIEGKAEQAVRPEEALRVLKVIEEAFRYSKEKHCLM